MVVGKTCEQWIKEGKGATTRDNPPRLGPGSGLIAEIGMEPAQMVWRASDWAREQIADPAIKWTRLSCRTFAANAVRLQLHAQLGGQTTRGRLRTTAGVLQIPLGSARRRRSYGDIQWLSDAGQTVRNLLPRTI